MDLEIEEVNYSWKVLTEAWRFPAPLKVFQLEIKKKKMPTRCDLHVIWTYPLFLSTTTSALPLIF